MSPDYAAEHAADVPSTTADIRRSSDVTRRFCAGPRASRQQQVSKSSGLQLAREGSRPAGARSSDRPNCGLSGERGAFVNGRSAGRRCGPSIVALAQTRYALDSARNNARCTQERKTVHGLDAQHQDLDRTLRGRVSQNDRGGRR